MANPIACLLVIGNEILSGRTQDVNINFLAKRLGEIGMPLQGPNRWPDWLPQFRPATGAGR